MYQVDLVDSQCWVQRLCLRMMLDHSVKNRRNGEGLQVLGYMKRAGEVHGFIHQLAMSVSAATPRFRRTAAAHYEDIDTHTHTHKH